ncbi:MAG TPA: sulfite exporter TauE/SafE family protein [Methylomirabilota bacterium]|nr:sulfite exporter TauE/SafE family protein [Methylomirabilota bacterium]
MIEALLPPEVSLAFAVLLALGSAATSALTAAFGLGGGIAMLALMSLGVPVAALIPVHGVVQLGSNIGRAVVQRRHIDWRTMGVFAAGSLVGAGIGALVVISLPEPVLKIGLSAFIAWAVFAPKPRLSARGSDALIAGGGVVSTFASMFFGATGPITMAVIATRGLVKHALVATFASAMVMQHSFKIAAFGSLGFDFRPWAPLLATIIFFGFLGTVFGSRVLDRIPDRWFMTGFRAVMILLAANLFVEGVRSAL